MSRALEKDIHQFMRRLVDSGNDDARLYVVWWRTSRHWLNQIRLIVHNTTPDELNHARREYVKACDGAARALEILEKKGVLKNTP